MCNYIKILDSRLHGNDKKACFSTFDEFIKLVDASRDFYLTANRYAERFEAEFADFLGLSNAILVNSGSSANLVALTTLTSPKLKDRRLKPGDEVIGLYPGIDDERLTHIKAVFERFMAGE